MSDTNTNDIPIIKSLCNFSELHTCRKTKKNKNHMKNNVSNKNKKKIWDEFFKENENRNNKEKDNENRNNKEKNNKENDNDEEEKQPEDTTNISLTDIYMERDMCDKCNSLTVISEEGFYICTNIKCAIIYDDVLNYSPEWRYNGGDDPQNRDPTRCGIPNDPLFNGSSNGCKVLYMPGMSFEMCKLSKYVQWQTMSYKDKSQYDDFQYIMSISLNNGISKKIIQDAFIYYKKIFESKNSFRGTNRDSIIASSIYIACRINNYPRSAKEIATIFKLDLTAATKGCKKSLNIINTLENNLEEQDRTTYCMARPSLFIERFCNQLDISIDLTLLCEFICLKIEFYHLLSDNTPPSIASGVIYFVSVVFKLNILKKEIKNKLKISEVTINKCFKKIYMNKEKFLPPSILSKYNIDILSIPIKT